MMLIIRKMKQLAYSIHNRLPRPTKWCAHQAVRLQGSRNWEIVWETLTEFADQQGLCRVHLDLNVPWCA